MSAPFPQLLRRSAFATHDPLITRVYTSTPSSVQQHGDFGLKYPIHRTKGPRYIKVNALDAGSKLGAEWRSAESEARFMDAWGRGGVWNDPKEVEMKIARNIDMLHPSPRYSTREEDALSRYAEKVEEGSQGAGASLSLGSTKRSGEGNRVMWMPDVDSMSEREFQRYVEGIRRERKSFLSSKLGSTRGGERERNPQQEKEEQTLVYIGTKGHAASSDSGYFQAQLTGQQLAAEGSTKLHSVPHRTYGLGYSTATGNGRVYPGRALDRDQSLASRNPQSRLSQRQSIQANSNRDWVIGIGGITAKLSRLQASVRDQDELKVTDYTRADPTQGEDHFRVSRAKITTPPTVLSLATARSGDRWKRRNVSGAMQSNPLDTFEFDIHLSEPLSSVDSVVEKAEVGSREWVGAEDKKNVLSKEDILGKQRSDRFIGEGLGRVRELERLAKEAAKDARASTMESVKGMLARISQKKQE